MRIEAELVVSDEDVANIASHASDIYNEDATLDYDEALYEARKEFIENRLGVGFYLEHFEE